MVLMGIPNGYLMVFNGYYNIVWLTLVEVSDLNSFRTNQIYSNSFRYLYPN